MAKRILTDDEIKWAYEKWCDGYTLHQIGDALYVSHATIYNALKGKPRIRPALHYERRCDNG